METVSSSHCYIAMLIAKLTSSLFPEPTSLFPEPTCPFPGHTSLPEALPTRAAGHAGLRARKAPYRRLCLPRLCQPTLPALPASLPVGDTGAMCYFLAMLKESFLLLAFAISAAAQQPKTIVLK